MREQMSCQEKNYDTFKCNTKNILPHSKNHHIPKNHWWTQPETWKQNSAQNVNSQAQRYSYQVKKWSDCRIQNDIRHDCLHLHQIGINSSPHCNLCNQNFTGCRTSKSLHYSNKDILEEVLGSHRPSAIPS